MSKVFKTLANHLSSPVATTIGPTATFIASIFLLPTVLPPVLSDQYSGRMKKSIAVDCIYDSQNSLLPKPGQNLSEIVLAGITF